MRRILLLLILLWASPLEAAIAEVAGQESSALGNDQVLTLTSAVGASNHVLIFAAISTEAQTISITGTTLSWSTVLGPADSILYSARAYIFCAQGDGSDNTFTVTTSGTGNAFSFIKEFSGMAGCTAEDTEAADDNETPGNTFDLDEAGTLLSATDGALVVGIAFATTGTVWTPTGGGTGIGTIQNQSWAQWRTVSAGSYDTTWTTNSGEDALLAGATFTAAGGATARRGTLMGVLP